MVTSSKFQYKLIYRYKKPENIFNAIISVSWQFSFFSVMGLSNFSRFWPNMKYYCLLNSNELGRFTTRPLFSLVHAPTTQPKDRGQKKTVVGRRCCWLIPICTSLLVAVGDDTQLNLFGGCYIHCILAHPSIWADAGHGHRATTRLVKLVIKHLCVQL